MIPTYKVNTHKAQQKLNLVKEKAGSLPWRQAGEIVRQSIHHNFDVGGRYSRPGSKIGGSRKWKARKKQVAWRILQKSHRLKRSIYVTPLPNGAIIGSRGLKYNRAQNNGLPKRKLPARTFLVIQRQDTNAIGRLFRKHITVR